ncbi:MAG: 16S rRNA (guanine(966)-N(2))-methyltransferase RsmD, partial [Chloroflexi bacterium]|nr:16S rRNA (guanine(966)-N(2))-methyltransferase RsmD [Chloroflexota bacterium]NMC02648.1 16S rRNA (guanine(966)-N(2))-methyltransferase RsmD [Chloroflexota bacterium]
DFIYVAPPQYRGLWKQTLSRLDQQMEWLAEDGWVIVQIHPVEFEELPLQHLVLFDQRQYGSVMLCFYGRPTPEDDL